MTQKKVIILTIFLFSSCHPQIKENICPVSADEILSCIASSEHLSTQEVTSEFESLTNSINPELNTTKLNKLLCLSLHSHSSKEQLQRGESILAKTLKKTECKKQNLSGLLHIIQGTIYLHKKYLDKNWKLYLNKKKACKKLETDRQQLDNEIISYQRRIQDLEQQVQKLKAIESMLDTSVRP